MAIGRPIRWISGAAGFPRDDWPGSNPAVRQVLEDGLDLGGLTILVGENGAGKSTLTEAIELATQFVVATQLTIVLMAPDRLLRHLR